MIEVGVLCFMTNLFGDGMYHQQISLDLDMMRWPSIFNQTGGHGTLMKVVESL
jgi:hypothetical protein